MTNNDYPRLCGGIFLTLLLQARKQRTGSRERSKGESDCLKDSDVLIGLIRIVNSNYQISKISTIKTMTNSYKSCTHSKGDYLPFDDDLIVNEFDRRVKTEYESVLLNMNDFIETFLDLDERIGKYKLLVRALIELIERDEAIAIDSEFIIAQGQSIKKSDFSNKKSFNLSAFLLGVWHFIVTNIPNNKVGKITYDSWCPTAGHAKRDYVGNFGHGKYSQIEVLLDNSKQDSSTENYECEIEVVNEDNTINPTSSSQTINSPYVFNFTQHGDNNTQIGCVKNFYAGVKNKK